MANDFTSPKADFEPSALSITPDNCHTVPGPFYHGTKARLAVGDHLVTGHPTHFEKEAGRALRHLYFSAQMEPAIWGAELAVALSGDSESQGKGHPPAADFGPSALSINTAGYIYIVEPTGPFEDDPNLTNKRFPGNPTQSYRTIAPLRITGIVETWEGHAPETIKAMVEGLENLKRQGLNVIED